MAYSILMTTCSSKKEAQGLLTLLLENRLIACGNLIPSVESHYWWQGKIEISNEVLILLKTESRLSDDVIKFIKENHSYEVTEVLSLPIEKGNDAYLQWISDSLK